jgi:hypothetical protein
VSKHATIGVVDAMSSPALFGPHFAGASWDTWRAVLKAAFAEPMSDGEIATFRAVAERDPPRQRVSELDAIVGRGGGKDSIASLMASTVAVNFDPKGKLRPGEKAVVMCIAVDRTQAGIVYGYIRAYFEMIPALAAMVKSIDSESIELRSGVVIEVHTNSYRSVRGRSIICAIFDEVAFWRSEESATPDIEVHGAVAPGLARMPGSMLILISTAHKRSGLLYQRWKDHYGKDSDDTLVVKGTTMQFNSTFDAKIIARQLQEDPQLYAAEYNSQWRDDLSTFISRELLDAAVDRGVVVRPPVAGTNYFSFSDPSGGVHDSFTMAISHREKDDAVVLDMLYERKPPFNPSEIVEEIAALLKSYNRLSQVTGDKYAANWVVEAFAKTGIKYIQSERDRSAIYLDCLPLFTSGRARLIDSPRLVSQFASLERRTFSTGKDRVDHGRETSARDDACNSAAGALVLASSKSGYISDLSWVGAPEPGKGRSLWEHPMFHQNQRRSYR